MSALLIYPTHQNINEVVEEYEQHGVTAVAFPPRLTKDSEYHLKNCENAEADEAEQMGLSVVKAVCSGCAARKACAGDGYLADLMRAEQATVTLATHARAQMTSLSELAGGRDFVSIHEDPTSLLRPRMSLYETDLALVRAILSRALNDPRILNWFAAIVRDDDEEPSQSRTLQERRDAVYRMLLQLADLADGLAEHLRNASQSLSIDPPHVGEIPAIPSRRCSGSPNSWERRSRDGRGGSCWRRTRGGWRPCSCTCLPRTVHRPTSCGSLSVMGSTRLPTTWWCGSTTRPPTPRHWNSCSAVPYTTAPPRDASKSSGRRCRSSGTSPASPRTASSRMSFRVCWSTDPGSRGSG